MLNIAKTIREKRRAHGYTQERLAQALGLTPAAVSKWETGQTLPDVTMLGPLAAMLGITTDELLGFDPDVSEEHAEELVEPARDALARRDISGAIERCERALRLHPASITLTFAVASALMEIAQGACAADDPARPPTQEGAAKTALARSIELFERCRQEGSLEQREAAAFVLAGQYVLVGRHGEALEAARSIRAPQADPRIMEATALAASGELERAEELAQRTLEEKEADASALRDVLCGIRRAAAATPGNV
ncbi:helix-turn-helix transcriptional regulator [Collinsella tanakaei]|nr:helix-turn-helix transcriptional regulator [Collinsella tanakaei]